MAEQKYPTFLEWLAEHPDASIPSQIIAREFLERKDIVMARILAEKAKS